MTNDDVPGSRPDPDPTVLTTQALFREVTNLRDLFDQKFASVEEQRLAVRELVIRQTDTLTKENGERFVSLRQLLTGEIQALREVVDQKFDLIESHRIEQKKDTKDAVDAALSAAKEAVKEQTTASALSIAKSEAATTKQLEQQQLTTSTAVGDLRRSIDELKERLTEVDRNLREAISAVATTANGTVREKLGAKEDRTGLYAAIGVMATVLFVVIAVVSYVAARP